MDKDTKELALHLLIQKQSDLHLTYELIERETGYSKRQLIRLSSDLQEKDMESIMTHGNAGRKPVTTASDQEVSYLREMKKPYPLIKSAKMLPTKPVMKPTIGPKAIPKNIGMTTAGRTPTLPAPGICHTLNAQVTTA